MIQKGAMNPMSQWGAILLSKELRLLRFEYLETTIDVLQEANQNSIGAQERVAERRGKEPSVISDHVNRVANALGASFFEPGRDRRLSTAGTLMLKRGSQILADLDRLRSDLEAN